MKVMQIVNGICYSDITRKFPTVQSTIGFFPTDILFVETPDYVFEGWGYDHTKEGDDRFIKPTAPEGWLYDDATGTFYEEGTTAPSKQPTQTEITSALQEQVAAQAQQLKSYEECISEMAEAYTQGVNSI